MRRARDKDDDEDDEDAPVEGGWLGEIIGIDYKKKKEGAYKKGYYLLAQGPGGSDDTRVYVIASSHSDIQPDDNSKYRFEVESPAGADAAAAAAV